MIPLKARGKAVNIDTPIVRVISRIETTKEGPVAICNDSIESTSAILTSEKNPNEGLNQPFIKALNRLDHLSIGDVVAMHPNGLVETLFRHDSPHNALFITDRCNSNCLMCSQPPKDRDDLDYLYNINLQLVPRLPKNMAELGITGGEPTLLGDRLYGLLGIIKETLPETEVHMLTNGRIFAWKEWSNRLAKVDLKRLMLGIPLYSDYPSHHDFVVQSKDAFSQTMLGLYNLARANQRIELRIVLHKETYQRLPQLSKFIFKNLPFVEHIAFMGLEYTGYTPFNDSLLWIDPSDYVGELSEAVEYLHDFGMNVSIYNLQHCLIPQHLWQFSRNSISDWKRTYLDECQSCSKLNECGGVFATSKKYSSKIKAI